MYPLKYPPPKKNNKQLPVHTFLQTCGCPVKRNVQYSWQFAAFGSRSGPREEGPVSGGAREIS